MAIIQLGGGVTDIRGSMGGTTFARNAGGNYIRSRIKPVNPRTVSQSAARTRASYLTRKWSTDLTDANRTSWRTYAAGTTWTNRLGQTININALAAYLRTNSLLDLFGGVILDDGPTLMGHGGGVTAVFTATSGDQMINLAEPDGAWDKSTPLDWLGIFQGVPTNAGRVSYNRKWRFLVSVEGVETPPPTFPMAIPTLWTLIDEQIAALAVIHVDPEGRVSARTYSTAAVTPGP